MSFFTKKDQYGDLQPRIGNIIVSVVLFFLALILFFGSFTTVGAGYVGVVTRFGAVNRVLDPGFHFTVPLVEGVARMETRTQKEQVEAEAASKDLQDVHSTIALNYHLDGKNAVRVYQNIGVEYKDRVIAPAMQEAFKATTAKFTASDLIADRDSVKAAALASLKSSLAQYDIVVDNFNIVNFDFSKEFNQAIEDKQVAQQNLEKAKTEAETAVTQAKGQADAQKLLKDTGSLTSEYIQFLAVQKWDGHTPLSTSGVPFITLPTGK